MPEIGPDEWPMVILFLNMSTAWNYHPVAGTRTGLDYRQAPVMADMLEIKTSPAVLHGLRVMEAETIKRLAAAR